MEAWIKPAAVTRVDRPITYRIISNILGNYSPSIGSFDLLMHPLLNREGSYTYRYEFSIPSHPPECYTDANTYLTAYRREPMPESDFTSWKHVAAVIDEGRLRIYENGKLIGKNDNVVTSFCKASLSPKIGAFYDYLRGRETDFFQGLIDEVRISNISRYKQEFIVPNLPFTTDANTMLLYHFDGNTLDSSSTANLGRDGRAIGKVTFVDSTISRPISGPIVCKEGINSFAVESPCGDDQFAGVTFQCHDGQVFNLGSGGKDESADAEFSVNGCKTSEEWSAIAKKACQGRSSCKPKK